MTDVLFGQSYYLRFDPKLWAAMQPYPPLGTLYAASTMRARGYDVRLFDAMLAESESEWTMAIDSARPSFAVLFEDNFNYLSKMCLLRMREAAGRMIGTARSRGCTVIVAGSDVTDHPGLYLANGAHFAIVGEGEATLAELIDRLAGRHDRPIESIAGLAFTNGSRGPIARTAPRPDLRDLDTLPFPAWDLVDSARYRALWRRHGYYSVNMVTTRGCPYHCNWCAKPIWGQRYNVRSPENVIEELGWLNRVLRPDHVWFADDIFGLIPGWIDRYAELARARGTRVPFKCLSRADLLLRPGEIDALARAGCVTVWLGAESGSQRILDAMDKGISVGQIREAVRRLHDAGIEAGLFLQFGYPGENRDDIAATFRLVRQCRPDDIGVSVAYPLPGTPFYDRVRQSLGRRHNWVDSSDLAMLYHGPFPTTFYRRLHRLLHAEFRVRRAWERLRQPASRGASDRRSKPRLLASLARNAGRWPIARLALERAARQPHRATEVG